MSDNVRVGRVQTKLRDSRTISTETGQGNHHVSPGDEPRHVGHKHFREESSGISSNSTAFLRALGLDNNHSRVYAASNILQVSFHRLPLRNLEKGLQNQADVHVALN